MKLETRDKPNIYFSTDMTELLSLMFIYRNHNKKTSADGSVKRMPQAHRHTHPQPSVCCLCVSSSACHPTLPDQTFVQIQPHKNMELLVTLDFVQTQWLQMSLSSNVAGHGAPAVPKSPYPGN